MSEPIDLLAEQIDIHTRYSAHQRDLYTDVRTALALTGGEHVLDIGCGTGALLHTLCAAGHSGDLVGTDIRAEAVTTTAAHPGVQAVLADATELPFPAASVDRVSAMHLIYYLPDPAHALAEWHRVLKRDGIAVVTMNHVQTAPRLRRLVAEHAARLGYTERTATQVWAPDPGRIGADAVDVDRVELLMRNEFSDVTVNRCDNALVFPEPEPVQHYADVLARFAFEVPAGSPDRATLQVCVGEAVRARFRDHGGPWRDPKGYCVLTGRA
ncbi:class I SAM-dependent methyltransferase [Nocardia sp. NPDC049220]|uniref:class I SAM-dependent methyltransferase n=1 Tax=Nocardia sp. NPDC049220 TaxID=3155273 RepID=UPI0033C66F92